MDPTKTNVNTNIYIDSTNQLKLTVTPEQGS